VSVVYRITEFHTRKFGCTGIPHNVKIPWLLIAVTWESVFNKQLDEVKIFLNGATSEAEYYGECC
jgi:hypothetical protein